MSTPRTIRTVLAGLTLAATASLSPLAAAPASAKGQPQTALVTIRAAEDGKGGQLPNGALDPVLTPSGRFLAFTDNKTGQTYVQDLLSGQAQLVSVSATGQGADSGTTAVGISADGNRVAFVSGASNLVPGSHSNSDLYVRDRKAAKTTRANLLANNALAPLSSQSAGLDDAGTTVTWSSSDYKVWVRHLDTGKTERADVSSAEVGGDSYATGTKLSGNGKFVVFSSAATNLVPGGIANAVDVYERNLAAGTTARVSVGVGGVPANNTSGTPSASTDGRFVAFSSAASNLVPGDSNAYTDVFVRDTVSGTTKRADVGPGGVQANHYTEGVQISGDGFSVAFASRATNLVAGDTFAGWNVFVRDLFNSTTTLVDRSIDGQVGADDALGQVALDDLGNTVAFTTVAANLVPGDTNNDVDTFVRLTEAIGPHSTFQQLVTETDTHFGVANPNGIADPIGSMIAGRITPTHYIALDAHAPQFAAHREPVARLYDAFFDRAPDKTGFAYWTNKHASGASLNDIATKFAESSEFKMRYGKLGHADFVKLVYQGVLKRPADAAGLAHWTAKLDQGMSRGQVMVQFSESAEGKRHLAAHVDAILIGLGMLGRIPNATEFPAAIAAYNAGGNDESIALYYLTSPEYLARY